MNCNVKKDWIDKAEDAWPVVVFFAGLIYRLIMFVDNAARQPDASKPVYPDYSD